jgi:hypothetical protein
MRNVLAAFVYANDSFHLDVHFAPCLIDVVGERDVQLVGVRRVLRTGSQLLQESDLIYGMSVTVTSLCGAGSLLIPSVVCNATIGLHDMG